MNNSEVDDVLELWVAERKLSRRKLAFLETVHQQTMECMSPSYGPWIAGQSLSSELDRPEAVYTCQLVADLLDFLKPIPGEPHKRLADVTQALMECNLIEKEQADALYASL